MKRYMVIERFRPGKIDEVYARLAAEGRLLPENLGYVDSWLNREHSICFQLMETDEPAQFEIWFGRWSDLVDFELFPLD